MRGGDEASFENGVGRELPVHDPARGGRGAQRRGGLRTARASPDALREEQLVDQRACRRILSGDDGKRRLNHLVPSTWTGELDQLDEIFIGHCGELGPGAGDAENA